MMLIGFTVFVTLAGLYFLGLHINGGLFVDFPQYCTNLGYPVQSHKVITDDGYILTVFRIQKRRSSTFVNNMSTILLQHGLLDSADAWITNADYNTTDLGPAFFFADRGFDVWVSNSRGNYYSRNHISYDPDRDKEFWDYTFYDMGMHDIPAVFNYIGNFTEKKINYIGHSQGTTQMFAALSQREPTIVSRLQMFVALAPAVYFSKESSPLFKAIDKDKALDIWEWFGVYEIYSRGEFGQWFASAICTYIGSVCALSNKLFSNGDNELVNIDNQDIVSYHFPSGSSIKSMRHFDQLKKEGATFRQYIYPNETENLEKYNSKTAPILNLSKIEEHVKIYAGDTDLLVNLDDVARIKADMGDRLNVTVLAKFGHSIFKESIDMSYLNDVLAVIDESNNITRILSSDQIGKIEISENGFLRRR